MKKLIGRILKVVRKPVVVEINLCLYSRDEVKELEGNLERKLRRHAVVINKGDRVYRV